MSKFKAFLKGSYKELEHTSLPLERFEEEIVLRPLGEESETIQESCFQNKSGRKGKQERVFNVVKYNRELCVASVVHPDLTSTELQEDLGVRGADNAYLKLFSLGERSRILETVLEINGLDQEIDEDIEEAKN